MSERRNMKFGKVKMYRDGKNTATVKKGVMNIGADIAVDPVDEDAKVKPKRKYKKK